jgi:hypothetical protein
MFAKASLDGLPWKKTNRLIPAPRQYANASERRNDEPRVSPIKLQRAMDRNRLQGQTDQPAR